jgi:hypothetical protein
MGGGLRRRDAPGGDLGARSRSDDDHDVGQPLGEECHHPAGLSPCTETRSYIGCSGMG